MLSDNFLLSENNATNETETGLPNTLPPHKHHLIPPAPPFTLTEDILQLKRKMHETIDTVLSLKRNIEKSFNDFTSKLTTDNVTFKDLLTSTYNQFSKAITDEVTSFETEMNNSYDLYKGAVDLKLDNFKTAVESRIAEYYTNIQEMFDNYVETMDSHMENLNNEFSNNYTSFVNSINETYSNFTVSVENRLDGQDAMINDAVAYMRSNLKASIRELLDEGAIDLSSSGTASYFGVDSSIGDNDATELLNNYFALLKSLGLRYAYFDVPHTYKVSGKLTEARDLILLGNATIESTDLDNYYIQPVKNLYKTFNGKVNIYDTSVNVFEAFNRALNLGRNVNITIFGDSISTGGGDFTDVTYSTATGWEGSPNGLSKGDAYYNRLRDLIVNKFKNNKFNFYQRSNGGAKIEQYNDSIVFNDVSKTWINHIIDSNPDLLIIAFGMNNTSYSSSKNFYTNLANFIADIEENMDTKPSIIVLTSPRPSMVIGDDWGSSERQTSVDLTAYQARVWGASHGCYIADVNKLSNIKRLGKTFDNPFFIEIAPILTSNKIADNGVYSFTTTDDEIKITNKCKSFSLEFDAEFIGYDSAYTDSNLWVEFNKVNKLNGSTILILPNKNTFGDTVLRVYGNRFSNGVAYDKALAQSLVMSQFYTFRIEKRNELVEIFVNNKLATKYINYDNNLPGDILIKMNGNTYGHIINIKNIKLLTDSYEDYTPCLTEYETWGEYELGNYDTKNGIGGNGVNHPSTIGLEQLYSPVLKELVEDMFNSHKSMTYNYVSENINTLSEVTDRLVTDSGAVIRYRNLSGHIGRHDIGYLKSGDGTIFKLRKGVEDFTDAVSKLKNNEFSLHSDNGTSQIFIASDNLLSMTLPFTFSGYFMD